jgi:hypothetical protein
MLFLMRAAQPAAGARTEWTAVTILTLCYFGFVAVISTWGTASAREHFTLLPRFSECSGRQRTGSPEPNGLLLPLLRDSGLPGLIARI